MPEFYTWAILLINQQDEIGEKQLSVFGSRGGQNSPLMHVPFSTAYKKIIKYRQMKKFLALSLSDVVFIMLINVKMSTIVDILTFMSRINFVLS